MLTNLILLVSVTLMYSTPLILVLWAALSPSAPVLSTLVLRA